MREKIKGVGEGLLGCMLMLGIVIAVGLIIGLFIRGGVWLSDKVYPWLVLISELALAICLLVLLPLAIFRKTRVFAGTGMMIASYVFGATLWTYSFLLAYVLWGVAGLAIGLFFLGVGVVPVAMLATIFKGMWAVLGQLMLVTAFTFGARFFGAFLIAKAEVDEETKIIDADYFGNLDEMGTKEARAIDLGKKMPKSQVLKKANVILCPSCNAYQDATKEECPNCGYEFTNI